MTTVLTPLAANSVEGKVSSLAAFILANLPAPSRNDASAPVRAITMLARSPDSPIAQAVLRLGSELADRNIRVRAIFASLDAPTGSGDWTSSQPVSGEAAIPFGREIRWARNPRYIDAHEQLVLHGSACWIGDCMRRDPAKRDALEQAKPKCAITAGFAATSFERLWLGSEPVALRLPHLVRAEIVSGLAAAAVVAAAAAAADKDESLVKS